MSTRLRWTLVAVGVLLFAAGVPTFVFAEDTDDLFAWTIRPPLTAAFMGAGYWATLALVLLAARERTWAHARIAVPGSLVFAGFTLAATFLHFEPFHERRPITWAWIAIYVAVPILLVVFTAEQLRSRGNDPPRELPMAPWIRVLLAAGGLVVAALGVALFAAPESVGDAWPWALTPLTGRVVAAWLLGLGFGGVHAALEGDWMRARIASATAVLFALFQTVNIVRYPDTFDWGTVQTWAYATALAGTFALGAEGLRRTLRRYPA